MRAEVIHERLTNKVRFTAENEEERKLLGNCTFYDASDEEINQARIAYFNPRSSEPIVKEAWSSPTVHELLNIAEYLFNKKSIRMLQLTGLPFTDKKDNIDKSNIIYVDFKNKEIIKHYKEMKWDK